MIIKTPAENLGKVCFVLIILILLSFGAAYSSDLPAKQVKSSSTQPDAKMDSNEWKIVLDAARKEGKLVMSGDPGEVWRKSLVDMFQQEYPEIKVEYIGMNGRDFTPRIQRERELGQKLWDLLSGGTTTAYELKKNGFTLPIRQILLPENADNAKWIGGLECLFYDKENKFMPTYAMNVQRTTYVNRDFIKESELKSSDQLLDPKFKGKIVMQNPTAGASLSALGHMGIMYGERFLRDLLTKQDVIITDDKRQQAEWVVRGKYPIAIGFNSSQLVPFVKQDLGRNVEMLKDKIMQIATSLSTTTLFKDAPHPNAAKVYINWLLSKNTQIRLTQNVLINSRRTDVPPVVKEMAVDPAHLKDYCDYSKEENQGIIDRFPVLIKDAMKK